MLTMLGNRRPRFCDGLSRRGFLRIGSLGFGSLGLGGLSLPEMLRAESQSGQRSPDRSVIMIYLPGGPTQHETFDPKPHAPVEIRGSFGTIDTAVPGVRFCESLPKLSRLAQKFSVVRTLVGMKNRHESFQCYTGRLGGKSEDNEPSGGWPSLGSVVSSLLGPQAAGTVPFVDAGPKMGYEPYNNSGQHGPGSSWPGFTGPQHVPFALEGDVKSDLVLNGVSSSKLGERRALLTAFSRLQRRIEIDGLDDFQRQAFDILTSSRLADAIDLEKEDPKVRQRYGETQATHPSYAGAPQSPQRLLLARRLVEAGVRCVTVAFGAWDWHGTERDGTLEYHVKKYLPVFDHALSVFLQDLDERGLLANVSVVVWGEFGRTPRINTQGGRDHWPSTQSVLLAGGGIQGGRVIGTTDRTGGSPIDRPVHVQEVFASLYRNLGIDVNAVKIPDLNGRPQYLVDDNRQPVAELY